MACEQALHPRRRQPPAVYARRRFAAAFLAAGLLAGLHAAGARADGPHRAACAVVVAPGDTLWALGQRYAPPREDLRRWTAQVEALNHLAGPALQPGQLLLIPPG